jgi:hypothetical protein
LKFRKFLEEYVLKEEVAFDDLRLQRLNEYLEICEVVRSHRPELADGLDTVSEWQKKKKYIDTYETIQYLEENHPDVLTLKTGHKNQIIERLDVSEEKSFCIRSKKNKDNDLKYVYLDRADAPLVDKWANWGFDDYRIQITKQHQSVFPVLCTWKTNRIFLAEFVYHVIHEQPVLDGHCVVHLNKQRKDNRFENLMYVAGTGKNHKSQHGGVDALFFPDKFNPGNPRVLMPRDVTVSHDKLHGFTFVKPRKNALSRTNFEKFILPVLHSMYGSREEYEANHAKYERMVLSFIEMEEYCAQLKDT